MTDTETPMPDGAQADLDVLALIDEFASKTVPYLAVILSPDVEGMIQMLVAVRRAQAQLRWAEEQLEDEIVKVMPAKDLDVPGVGTVTLRTGTSRKQWDNDGIVDVLVARIGDNPHVLCDPDTGETLPPHEVAALAIRTFLEVARPSWRTTQLRSYRIDPDEYCETTYGRKTLQTPPVVAWEAT